MKSMLACALLALGLLGCGGGGSGSSGTKTGQLIDSAVGGVSFSTPSFSGVTDSLGRFQFKEGELVTFSIGDIKFPVVTASAVVTPLTLANSSDINNRIVINIARLLQTLDNDADPDNGIQVVTPSSTAALNFDQDPSSFAAEVLSTLGLTLIDQAAAVEHLQAELDELNNQNGGGSNNPDVEPASVPAGLVGSYELKFGQAAAGSGIADDSTATFVVGADSSLTLPSGKVLTNPIFYLGNKAELIWVDAAADLSYALSDALSPKFNEINIANSQFYDEAGFIYYGQYRLFEDTGLTPAQQIAALEGDYTSAVTFAQKNVNGVPTSAPGDIRVGDQAALTISAAGSVGAFGNSINPGAADFKFQDQFFDGQHTYVVSATASSGDFVTIFLNTIDDELVAWNYTAENATTRQSVSADIKPYLSKHVTFIDELKALAPISLTFIKDDPNVFGYGVAELCSVVTITFDEGGKAGRPRMLVRNAGENFDRPQEYTPTSADYEVSGSATIMDFGFSQIKLDGSVITLNPENFNQPSDDTYTNDQVLISSTCGS